MKYSDGHIYEGQYVNDLREGFGIYYFKNNDKYHGQFVSNKRNGFGVYNYSDGTVYTGFWENNVKHGYGTLVYSDCVVIRGIFNNGDIKFGDIEFPNNSRYHGEIDSFMMNGTGNFKYSDDFNIEGKFVKDFLIVDDKSVCVFCCESNCDYECYEMYEGICGKPELF
jgi:hypothetical protein